MEIDRQKINQILNMSDREFASVVYSVVFAASGDDAKARMAMSLAPMIKEKLQAANDYELQKVLETVGEEKVRGIFDSLQP